MSYPIGNLLVSGNVGIGTTSPLATLNFNGYSKLKINASAPVTCDAVHEGSIAYAGTTTHYLCFCDCTSWKRIGPRERLHLVRS